MLTTAPTQIQVTPEVKIITEKEIVSSLPIIIKKIEIPTVTKIHVTDAENTNFNILKKNIFDRNHDLSTVFEDNISFISFKDKELIW